MPSKTTLIIGLGAMGSAALYHCAKRGHNVLGFDQYSPPHALGSTHGKSRIIRQAYFEGEMYVPLVLRAYELWRELERESGRNLLTITGGLMLGDKDSEVMRGSRASAEKFGIPYELLDAKEIVRRYPAFAPEPSFAGLFEKHAGFLEPEECVKAHILLAEKCGAEIRCAERVIGWKAGSDGGAVEVLTNKGSYTGDSLIIACGPWSSGVVSELHLPLSVERAVMFWFKPKVQIEQFAPNRFPIYIWGLTSGLEFYGFPLETCSATTLKVAFHTVRTPCNPDTIQRQVSDKEIKTMQKSLARYMPALDGECVDSATCMYTMTPDHDFILDTHPRFPQVAIAAGFSGHGFKFSSVVGEIMADLSESGSTKLDISGFRLRRFIS